MNSRNPKIEVAAGNPWYAGCHFDTLRNPGVRWIVESRWVAFADAIAQWLKISSRNSGPLRILDAGCGDGMNGAALTKGLSSGARSNLFGIDYNYVRCQRAMELNKYSLIACASLAAPPFNPLTFDIISCNHVLEHIPDDKSVLCALAGLLVSGGLLILGVPNEGCYLGQLRNRFMQPSIQKKTDHVHFYTEPLIRSLLTSCGYSVLSVWRKSFFLPHTAANALLASLNWGRGLLDALGSRFPSQAADLIFAAIKVS